MALPAFLRDVVVVGGAVRAPARSLPARFPATTVASRGVAGTPRKFVLTLSADAW